MEHNARQNDTNTAPPEAGPAAPWRRRLRHARQRVVVATVRASRDRRVRWGAAGGVVLSVLTAGTWYQTCGFDGCPTPQVLREWQPRVGDRLLTHDGSLLGFIDPVRRAPVPLAQVPQHVRDAFVAVEDRRFREHDGVDWRGVARATVANLRAGGVAEGASTITMQLARNAFLTDEVRGFKRKALEVRYARLLENALDKDEILERYLNTIYFGNGLWGVEAAARDLLGKPIARASRADAALLAGLPKAPSSYNPRRNPKRARERRDVVVGVLVDAGVIDAREAARIRTRSVRPPARAWRPSWPEATWASDVVRATLDSLREAGTIPAGLAAHDVVVHTTIDRVAQRAAERAVADGAQRVDRTRRDAKDHPTQGALIALDPATGAVRAVVGGRVLEARGFNRALSARRQVGSTFKPFVFATAIAEGYAGNRMLTDEPVTLRTGRTTWTPTNYGDARMGRMTMRTALARSNNVATVRLAQDLGNARIIRTARANGITGDLPDVPSLSLGAASLTPLDLTTAYAPFANGGWRVTPHVITRIEDADGQLLWERPLDVRERVLSVEDAFLVTSMLQSVVDAGTGRPVRDYGVEGPVAGKTGTTNDGADTWFVGYSPSLLTGVWFGADAPRSLGAAASGGRYAAPVWAEFMRRGWHSPEDDRAWTPPPVLIARTVDARSGRVFGDWCDGSPQREYFKPGTEPKEVCGGDWFRFAADGFKIEDEAFDAAMEAMGEAIGDGRIRQGLLRMIGEEVKRQVVAPEPPKAPRPPGER